MVFDRLPPPLTVQVTPALFLSLVTVAVSVVESAPSTVIEDAVIATLIGLELPPQPDKHKAALTAKADTKIPLSTNTPRLIAPGS